MNNREDLEFLEGFAEVASYDGFAVKVFILDGMGLAYPVRVSVNTDNYDFCRCSDAVHFISGLSVIKPVKRMTESAMILGAYRDGVRTISELAQWKNKKGLK